MGERETIDGPDGSFHAYLARPERVDPPAIVLLHEVFGVNSDIRQTADELAALGYAVLCPDLFWRQEPDVDLDVRSEKDWNKGLELYQALDRDQAVKDVIVTLDQARRLDGTSGTAGLMGYCLGGLLTFLTAARSTVDAAVAYHGADTEKYLAEAGNITAPFLMHLAGEDEFMPPAARAAIVDAVGARPNFTVHTYPGCNHAFSRHGGLHYNASAADLSRRRTAAFLKRVLG